MRIDVECDGNVGGAQEFESGHGFGRGLCLWCANKGLSNAGCTSECCNSTDCTSNDRRKGIRKLVEKLNPPEDSRVFDGWICEGATNDRP